jgi:hypothetical protein
MNTMSRTLLVGASSAGLVLGSAMAAGASEKDGRHGYNRDWDKGWLTVCQYIKDDYRHHHGYKDGYKDDGKHSGYDDSKSKMDSRYRYGDDRRHNDDRGLYQVVDRRGKSQWIRLDGKRDCATVKVLEGWARVIVRNTPDDTSLKSQRNQWVKIRDDKRSYVLFTYEKKHDHDHHYDSARR